MRSSYAIQGTHFVGTGYASIFCQNLVGGQPPRPFMSRRPYSEFEKHSQSYLYSLQGKKEKKCR